MRNVINCILAVAVVSLFPGQAFAQDRKAELAAIAHQARDGVNDIAVSFSFNAIDAPPVYPDYRYSANVFVHGDKILTDSTYGPDPTYLDRTFRREVAFNGSRTTTLEVHNAFARVADGETQETRTIGLGFFDLALLNPPIPDGYGVDDVCLTSLLDAPDAVVRPQKEEVNGVSCDVVDYVYNGTRVMTAWVDADRGCLPVRWVLRPKTLPERTWVQYDLEDAAEITPGLWLPLKGTKTVTAQGSGQPYDVDIKLQIEVERDGRGQPMLAVNSGIDDSIFNLWAHVPPGTEVWDVNADERWIASAGSYFDIYQVLCAALDSHGCALGPDYGRSTNLKPESIRGLSQVIPAVIRDGVASASVKDSAGIGRVSCGPASLAICLRLSGCDTPSESDLRALPDANGTTSMEELGQFVRRKTTAHAYAGVLTPEQLISMQYPVLLFLHPPVAGQIGSAGHFVVYVRPITDQSAFIFDPTGQTGLHGPVSLEALTAMWSGESMLFSRESIPSLESTPQPRRIIAQVQRPQPMPPIQAAGLIGGIGLLGICVGSLSRRH